MPNSFLTPSAIANEALMILESATVACGLVYRDYEQEWTGKKKGDTISIRKPATLVANEFTGTSTAQTVTETSVSLTLEKHFDVPVSLTSKDLSLSLEDFAAQIVKPAVVALVEKVNAYVLGKYTGFPYFYDAGSTSPDFPDSLAEVAQIDRVLNDNKVPTAGRVAIVSSTAKADLIALDVFARADARGDNGTALREASMGRVLGFDWYMDQQIQTHTAGSFSTTGTPAINGAVLAGATTMAVDGGSGTETLKKGDLFTVADVSGQYVVTADATATSGAIASVSFYPAAPTGGFPNDKAITVKKTHKANLAMHPNAMALAVVPLEAPMGGATGSVVSYKGFSIRVVMGYDMSGKANQIAFDLLCGAAVIQPELGARVLE